MKFYRVLDMILRKYDNKQEEYKDIIDQITEKVGSEDLGVKINIGDNFYYPAVSEIYSGGHPRHRVYCEASSAPSDIHPLHIIRKAQ